jgi:hypothetical protein
MHVFFIFRVKLLEFPILFCFQFRLSFNGLYNLLYKMSKYKLYNPWNDDLNWKKKEANRVKQIA